jgi:hypothetical protein
MLYITNFVKEKFKDIEVKYFECDEVYSYSE